MPPPHLHVIAIDPGKTTGWVRLTIPRDSIYGREDGEFWEQDWGEIRGAEEDQTLEICRMVRTVQGLDFPVGPALVVEDFDVQAKSPTTDGEVLLSPVRIGAMLRYAKRWKQLGYAHIVFQPRALAKSQMTDERLEDIGMYVAGDHIRDAMRHAITAIRRAKKSPEFRDQMWARA